MKGVARAGFGHHYMISDMSLIEEKVISALYNNYIKSHLVTKIVAHPSDGSHFIQLTVPDGLEL